MLLEACCRLSFSDATRKPEQRSFVLKLDDEVLGDLNKIKKILLSDYGLPGWVSSLGVSNYTVRVALKRLARCEEYPSGRYLMADTQVEWDNIRDGLDSTPKTYSFYGMASHKSEQDIRCLFDEIC